MKTKSSQDHENSFNGIVERLIKRMKTGQCCANEPIFKVTFENGQTFLVCLKCSKLAHWSRFVKNRQELK
jgi:hypothetical protein